MKNEAIPTPYTVVIDTREQRPFPFASPLWDAKTRRHYSVQTTRGTLASGDYSLATFESDIAIERKSLGDLYGTLGKGRARFQRELIRLHQFRFAAIVVEADWPEILTCRPPRSRLLPKTIFMSVVAWQMQYRNIHWWMCAGREMAEVATIRLLDRFWMMARGGRVSAGMGVGVGAGMARENLPAGVPVARRKWVVRRYAGGRCAG